MACTRLIGGNCIIRDPTRRRHAASPLLMLQNPHYLPSIAHARSTPGPIRPVSSVWRAAMHGTACRSAGGVSGPGYSAEGGGKTRPAHPLPAYPVQNSPSTPLLAAIPVQNSPCSLEMALFGAFCVCRANFVPLWPATSQAGRSLYRIRGGHEANRHNRTPGTTGAEGAGGTGGPGRGAGGRWRGLAGLRGAAPNEVRMPSLAGGRAIRRPKHQRHRNNRHRTNAPRHTKNRHPDRTSACGGARGIRTPDLLIANETRYQLRHSPKDSNSLAPSYSAVQADQRRVRHDTGRELKRARN